MCFPGKHQTASRGLIIQMYLLSSSVLPTTFRKTFRKDGICLIHQYVLSVEYNVRHTASAYEPHLDDSKSI